MNTTRRPGRGRLPESKTVAALLCGLALICGGCTTTQLVDPRSPAAAEVDLKPGEDVAVFLADGRELDLSVVEWTDDRLVGRDRKNATHTIAHREIERLEVTRFSPGKTASIVAAIAIVALSSAMVDYSDVWGTPAPAIY